MLVTSVTRGRRIAVGSRVRKRLGYTDLSGTRQAYDLTSSPLLSVSSINSSPLEADRSLIKFIGKGNVTMAHAHTTILNVVRSGANIELSMGQPHAHTTLLEVARIVAQTGSHATIDVSGQAATTAEEIAKIGGRNVTVRF